MFELLKSEMKLMYQKGFFMRIPQIDQRTSTREHKKIQDQKCSIARCIRKTARGFNKFQ